MSRTAVILVNFHGASDTEICIESLQGCPSSPLVIVVDNSPDDPDLAIVLAKYPECKLIRSSENLGFGCGCNLGSEWALAQTMCEFVFMLNNDAAISTDVIVELEAVMDAHTEVGLVAPKIVLADDLGTLWYGGGIIDWRRGGARVPGFHGASDNSLAQQAREVEFASGCAMLIRRSVLEQIGMFDPRFFMYEEDVNFCLRATNAGWKIRYEPSAVVLHAPQGSLRDRSAPFVKPLDALNPKLGFYLYHIMRNRTINGLELSRSGERLKFFLCYPLYLSKLSLGYLVKGQFRPVIVILRAVRDGFIQSIQLES